MSGVNQVLRNVTSIQPAVFFVVGGAGGDLSLICNRTVSRWRSSVAKVVIVKLHQKTAKVLLTT